MKALTYLASLCISLFLCCHERKTTSFTVDDLSRDTIFKSTLDRDPYGSINIRVAGEVDDSIRINNAYFAGGEIDTIFQQDWYTKELSIFYYKYKAETGKLTISYQ